MTTKAHVVHLSDVPTESSASGLAALLRSPEDRVRRDTALIVPSADTVGRIMTVGFTTVYPGCSTRGHAHDDREEIYIVVRGRGTVLVGDDAYDVGTDDVLYIPPGPLHTARNVCGTPFEYYWITVAQAKSEAP